jgi:NCS1 family nucleobase:cation symporter-1
MPTREGDLSIEAHGMEPIPTSARYGSVGRIFTVWFTPNMVPAAFFIGTLAAADFLQLGFGTALLGIVLGNVIGSLLVAFLSTMGPKTGMAQMPAARLAYGKSIVVPGLLNWLSCIGWDGINSLFGALALTILVPSLPFVGALLIIVACQAALGIVGYEAIHTFEKWGAVALTVMFAILTVAVLTGGKADTSLADGFAGADQIGALVAFVAIVASFVLAWALYASDYSRYLPESTDTSKVFWYTFLGLSLSSGWLEVLGLLVAKAATGGESSDTINTILGGGLLGSLAMVAIAFGTVAVNAMNDYTGSLSIQAAGARIPRVYSAAVVAILGFAFTLYLNSGDFAAKFTNYLLFISYAISPWAGVVVADWLRRGRRADVSGLSNFSALPSGATALVALIVGFVVSLPFQNATLGYDIAANFAWLPINWVTANVLHYADIAYYVGFAVSFLIVWAGGAALSERKTSAT